MILGNYTRNMNVKVVLENWKLAWTQTGMYNQVKEKSVKMVVLQGYIKYIANKKTRYYLSRKT
jgi:hypothetical protein